MKSSEPIRQAILEIEAISSTPLVLSKIYRLLHDPSSHLDEIASVIQTDTGLITDIIRIANSPLYGPHIQHTRLDSALRTIGLREVFRLVSLSIAQKLFLQNLESYRISSEDFWSYSLLSGLIMEALAKRLGLDAGDAYLVGIMHATGRIIINQVLQEEDSPVRWSGKEALSVWEKQSVGLDSAEAGAMLLRQWHFPSALCTVIAAQFAEELPEGYKSLLGALQFVRRVLPVKQLHGAIADPALNDPFLLQCRLSIEEAHSLIAQSIEKLIRLESSVLV